MYSCVVFLLFTRLTENQFFYFYVVRFLLCKLLRFFGHFVRLIVKFSRKKFQENRKKGFFIHVSVKFSFCKTICMNTILRVKLLLYFCLLLFFSFNFSVFLFVCCEFLYCALRVARGSVWQEFHIFGKLLFEKNPSASTQSARSFATAAVTWLEMRLELWGWRKFPEVVNG